MGVAWRAVARDLFSDGRGPKVVGHSDVAYRVQRLTFRDVHLVYDLHVVTTYCGACDLDECHNTGSSDVTQELEKMEAKNSDMATWTFAEIEKHAQEFE